MAVTARVITLWQEPNTAGATLLFQTRHPKILEDYFPLSWQDVTGSLGANFPLDANLLVLQGVWTTAQATAFLADANYGAPSVLWDSVNGNNQTPITQNQINAIGTYLINHFNIPTALVALAKASVQAGDTRESVANKLATWLKNRPKAS